MSRETLKDFINSAGSGLTPEEKSFQNLENNQRLEYKLNVSEGTNVETYNTDLDKELIDFTEDNESILSKYVKYIINPANSFYQTGKMERGKRYERGDKIATVERQGDKLFSNINNPGFERTNSEYFPNKEKAIEKTGKDLIGTEEIKSGHNILKSVEFSSTGLSTAGNPTPFPGETGDKREVKAGTETIVKQSQDMLLNNNRFGNNAERLGKNFTDDIEEDFEEGVNNKGTYVINSTFGVHDKEKYVMTMNKLKSLGEDILKKSSGFNYEVENIGGTHQNNRIGLNSFKKINNKDYRAKSAPAYPEDNNSKIREDSGEFFNQNSESFGHTYNSKFQFFGNNQQLHLKQAGLSLKAISLLLEETIGTIQSSTGQEVTEQFDNSTHGPFILGKARSETNGALQFIKEKILVRTLFSYRECVDRGMQVCFNNDIKSTTMEGAFPAKDSAGFWLSVAVSVLKSFEHDIIPIINYGEIDTSNAERLRALMYQFHSNTVLKFFNTMATIGDISFKAFGSADLNDKESILSHYRNIDNLADTPGTRFSKNRMQNGITQNRLSYAQGTVPSMYLLPTNVVRAASKMDEGPDSPNPFRAMVGSELVKNTYFGANLGKSGNRISKDAVKALEDKLDAEYVPFYIQDLRTNEIISFHAFLSSLSDSFSPNYSTTTGYGRLDKVSIYESTTRSVSCDFTLFATSKEDFDSMWFKINKLITLIYPQWTQGTPIQSSKGRFIQPFSQVIGATPVVRLRVGDVIKSNYSKFNFSRIFGIGDDKILNDGNPLNMLGHVSNAIIELMMITLGSPWQLLPHNFAGDIGVFKKGFNNPVVKQILGSEAAKFLPNGFVNPATLAQTITQLKDPAINNSGIGNQLFSGGYVPGTSVLMLRANNNTGYLQFDKKNRIFTSRPIKVLILEKQIVEKTDSDKIGNFTNNNNRKRTKYKVKILDGGLLFANSSSDALGLELECDHTDLVPIPSTIFQESVGLGGIFGLSNFPQSTVETIESYVKDFLAPFGINPGVVDLGFDLMGLDSPELKFMEPDNNPFVKAYQSTQGRGLAGVLGGMTFNWYDDNFPWEVDFNARAPRACKIQLKLDVIHDIPPGIDHSGFNRAPIYNVGNIMKDISGDVYDDNGVSAASEYVQTSFIKKQKGS